MITDAVTRRAKALRAQGEPFVTATVVRAQRPTSVRAGSVAIVLGDGTIEGFIGGVCAEQSVRVHSLKALASGEPVLLRILPDVDETEAGIEGHEVSSEEGSVTVKNPCLSGGAIEVFIEPVLPAPRVLVVGETPIAAAVMQLGSEVGLDVVAVDGGTPEPAPGDLALVVAAHGRDELHTLRRALEAGVPYVGLVASRKRGEGVIDELRGDGVPDELLASIEVPAGISIGAQTPPEIAVSILARVVAVRRCGPAPPEAGAPEGAFAIHRAAPAGSAAALQTSAPRPGPPALAVDPICGMTVAAVPATPSLVLNGETVYFCCEGCKSKFEAQHEHAGVSD
jgi:xanthine dehydrogenase accessory factor